MKGIRQYSIIQSKLGTQIICKKSENGAFQASYHLKAQFTLT